MTASVLAAGRVVLVLGVLSTLASCGDAIAMEVVRDDCPDDLDKAFPGLCGCGVPEAACGSLAVSLVHRYGFDGTGFRVVDSVGGADGTAINAALSGTGELVLQGGDTNQYAELPDGLLSALSSATLEVWVSREQPKRKAWDRIFDFGVSTGGDTQQGNGESYLFLAAEEVFRTAFLNTQVGAEIRVDAPVAFPLGVTTHVAVVVDQQVGELRLYLGGVQQGVTLLSEPLSSVRDVNNWLGRSQFIVDGGFGGSLREFRIYRAALSQAELAASFALGESPYFVNPLER